MVQAAKQLCSGEATTSAAQSTDEAVDVQVDGGSTSAEAPARAFLASIFEINYVPRSQLEDTARMLLKELNSLECKHGRAQANVHIQAKLTAEAELHAVHAHQSAARQTLSYRKGPLLSCSGAHSANMISCLGAALPS